VVFFQHGVLDTSLGWVANGVQGSAAFAAYDQGFDVWLGNSRANPPRLHSNRSVQRGGRYWNYSINELGLSDIAAQIGKIHQIKVAELEVSGEGEARCVMCLCAGALALVCVSGWMREDNVAQTGDCQATASAARHSFVGGVPPPRADLHIHYSSCAFLQSPSHPGRGSLDGQEARGVGGLPVLRRVATELDLSGSSRGGGNSSKAAAGLGGAAAPGRGRAGPHRQPSSTPGLDVNLGEGGALRPLRRSRSAAGTLLHDSISPAASSKSYCREGRRGGSRGASGSSGQAAVGGAVGTDSSIGGSGGSGANDGITSAPAEVLPYRLQAVGHSLGAAGLLMYVVVCRMRGVPHHLQRLVLLSPAGIHRHVLRCPPFVTST
jgi:hypothetical protein